MKSNIPLSVAEVGTYVILQVYLFDVLTQVNTFEGWPRLEVSDPWEGRHCLTAMLDFVSLAAESQ